MPQSVLTPASLSDREGFFARLEDQPADPLLSLIGAFRDDPRPGKLDLGVGVYRTEDGRTPVMAAVKAAEARLLEAQETKAYLGPEGDVAFLERLFPVIFGRRADAAGVVGLQTPGGTGAVRLGAELIGETWRAPAPGGRVRVRGRVLVGAPTWPNHESILAHLGLEVVSYAGYDGKTRRFDMDAAAEAFSLAEPGDVALLHGCCHNPTGADPTPEQWLQIAQILARRGVTPLIDLAYQGLGDGLEADAAGARAVFEAAEDAILAYSLDKNFGLYRDRVGAIFVKSAGRQGAVRSNLLSLARVSWSMPPDHGAAVARTVLEDEALTHTWSEELDDMRRRLNGVRATLSGVGGHGDCGGLLEPLARQKGLFSLLPLSPAQIAVLRRDHGVYMAGSGRINIAGLNDRSALIFAHALTACTAGASS